MFDQVLENVSKATDATFQVQQEMFKKWIGLWPIAPPSPAGLGEPLKIQKKWVEIVGELLKKQRESVQVQFSAGLQNIEEAFNLAQAKDLEELRTKAVDLWKKSFECLRQASEAQAREFQTAAIKWTEVITREAA